MRNIGIIRKLDGLGRIVIPMEIRKNFAWEENDPISILTTEDEIILRKHNANCANCGEYHNEYTKVWGANICPKCYEKIRPILEEDAEKESN